MRGGIRLVRDHEDDHPSLFGDLAEGRPQSVARGGVEIARGFVGEDHLRLEEQRAGDGHALLFASAEGFGAMAQAVLQALLGEKLTSSFLQFWFRNPVENPRKHHVFKGGERGQQIELLEDDPDRSSSVEREFRFRKLVDTHARHPDLAFIGDIETGQQVQQRALAAA